MLFWLVTTEIPFSSQHCFHRSTYDWQAQEQETPCVWYILKEESNMHTFPHIIQYPRNDIDWKLSQPHAGIFYWYVFFERFLQLRQTMTHIVIIQQYLYLKTNRPLVPSLTCLPSCLFWIVIIWQPPPTKTHLPRQRTTSWRMSTSAWSPSRRGTWTRWTGLLAPSEGVPPAWSTSSTPRWRTTSRACTLSAYWSLSSCSLKQVSALPCGRSFLFLNMHTVTRAHYIWLYRNTD